MMRQFIFFVLLDRITYRHRLIKENLVKWSNIGIQSYKSFTCFAASCSVSNVSYSHVFHNRLKTSALSKRWQTSFTASQKARLTYKRTFCFNVFLLDLIISHTACCRLSCGNICLVLTNKFANNIHFFSLISVAVNGDIKTSYVGFI